MPRDWMIANNGLKHTGFMKINFTFHSLLLLFLCTFYSCGQKTEKDPHGCIPADLLHPEQEGDISPYVKHTRLVRLSMPDPYFFGSVSSVLFTDSAIYAVDRKQDCVFRFTPDGRFLNKIGSRGNGPGEYVSLSNVCVNDGGLFLCDIGSRKIHCHTLDGKYMKTLTHEMEEVYDDIAPLPGGGFLCHCITGTEGSGKIWLMDKDGKKKKDLLRCDDFYYYTYSPWSTLIPVADPDKVEILDPITRTVYEYDAAGDTLKIAACFESNRKGSDSYPRDFKKPYVPGREDCTDPVYAVETDSCFYTLWSAPKASIRVVCDKRTQTSRSFAGIKGGGLHTNRDHFFWPVSSNLPGAAVYVQTDECPPESIPECYRAEMSEQVALVRILNMK